LKASDNRRHLVDSKGKPFLRLGDTPWFLQKLPLEDVRRVMDDRKAKVLMHRWKLERPARPHPLLHGTGGEPASQGRGSSWLAETGPRGAGSSLSRPQDSVPQQNQAIQRPLKP